MQVLRSIAWRNIVRHGRRTMLTVVTMTVGLGLFIGIDSLLKGMDRGAIDNMVDLTASAVKVRASDYAAEAAAFPLDKGLQDTTAIRDFIVGQPGVLGVTGRTLFLGQLSVSLDGLPVVGTVVEPATDASVFTLSESIRGSWFSSNAEEKEVILGIDLAKDMGAAIGDYVTISATTRYGASNADDFLVIGLAETTEPNVNRTAVYIDYAAAGDFLELEGLVTELDISIQRPVNLANFAAAAENLRDAVEARYPGIDAESFSDASRQFLELSKLKSRSTFPIILVILLIAGVGIVNTILMSVYSRVKEIGVLRAFGLRAKEISRLFLWEGTITGIIGSVAGVLVGIGFDTFLIFVGVDMEAMAKGMETTGIPIWGTLRGEWNPDSMAIAFVFGMIASIVAALIPARKAARIEVTNALRFV